LVIVFVFKADALGTLSILGEVHLLVFSRYLEIDKGVGIYIGRQD
jgi:hypothetical protein